jgi:hypothetical protein
MGRRMSEVTEPEWAARYKRDGVPHPSSWECREELARPLLPLADMVKLRDPLLDLAEHMDRMANWLD